MGLALLEYHGKDGRVTRFRMNLGSNRYWTYSIGDDEVVSQNGIRLIRNRTYSSPIMGPLPEKFRGRGILEIPNKHLSKEHRFIQMMSFRDKRKVGPAISEIYQVPVGMAALDDIPAIAFNQHMNRMNPRVDTIPCKIRESRMSEAMFLGAITSLIPKVLPVAGKLLGGLFGGKGGGLGGILGNLLGGGNKGGGGGAANILQQIGKPETMKLITDLVQQITSANTAKSQALALSNGAYFSNKNQRNAAAFEPPMSNAMVAPALLAALPALMPLLQQVLNPETMKALRENLGPEKTIAAVTDSVKEIGNLGLKGQQQIMGHLEKVHPKTDPLDAMVANMSIAMDIEVAYRRAKSVSLAFPELATHTLYGRSRIVYRKGQDLRFPVYVETPQTINRGIVQLTIKHAETLEILSQKKWRVEQIHSGLLDVTPGLPSSNVEGLESGEDYLVTVCLIWKNKAGENIGTCRKMLISLVTDFAFKGVEEAGEPIPLDDPTNYHAFWHKVWQGTFSSSFKSISFDSKYYYLLDSSRQVNARMETLTRVEETGLKKKKGLLKSGKSLSINALNDLIPRISTESPLGGEELSALRSPDFQERIQQVARTQVRFSGRSGETVSMWIYPVVKMQRVILQRIVDVDDNGLVTQMEDHPVFFPIPVLAQFVGLSSEVA